MKLRQRRTRALSLSVAAALLLAACGGDDSGGTAPPTTPAPTSATTGSDTTDGEQSPDDTSSTDGGDQSTTSDNVGGTLVGLIGNEPPHFNPTLTSDIAVSTVGNTMYEALFVVTREREVEPRLATDYEVSDDGLTYTLAIREGVEWHDGTPFTAADVKFNFDEVLQFHPAGQGVARRIASTEAPDDSTVIVTLFEPYAPFITSLAKNTMPLVAKHLYEDTDFATNPYNLEPVGTGPFVFEEYQPGQQVSVLRNTNYWGDPQPSLDRVVFVIAPDQEARLLAVQAGDVDHIMSAFIDTARVDELEAMSGMQLDGSQNNPQMFLLFFNNDEAPFDDPEVRKAIFMGIDRDLIAQSIFPGDYFGTAAESAIPRTLTWATNPDVSYSEEYPYDPDAARARLEAAGVTNLQIDLPYRSDIPGAQAMVEIIASNLADIGVSVNLQLQESALWQDRVFLNADYDMTVVNYTSFSEPVLGVDRIYRCEDDPQAVFTNASGYCNPELDEVLDRAATALSQEDRVPLYYEAQEIISSDLPTAVVVEQRPLDAIRADRFGGVDEFFRTGNWEHLYQL